MHPKSFRTFVDELTASGQLRVVSARVDKSWEIACIARWVAESVPSADAYALRFDQVLGHRQPLVVGLYATDEFYAQALGVSTIRGREPQSILSAWSTAMDNPRPSQVVDEAPVTGCVHRGDQCDLTALPAPVWTPGEDAGPYLTAAGVITKDRETGVQNLGVYRIQIHDPRTAGVFFGSDKQHGAIHFAQYMAAKEPMPIALVIGASPAVSFAAAAKTRYGVDELHIAGGLAGAPIPVVPGRTVDLHVPAEAEFVIEGYVHPSERRLEAPFGEGLGLVNAAAPAPVMEVSAICCRDAPLFHGYLQQLPPTEGHLIWQWGALGPLWFYLHHQLGLKVLSDLAILPGAAGLTMLVLQVREPDREQVARLMETVRAVNFGQKFVIVVDDDIDIRDSQTLQWAISTRVDPQSDARIIGDVATYLLDPATMSRNEIPYDQHSRGPFEGSMMLLDATLKCRSPALALPGEKLMLDVLKRWDEFELPAIRPRARLIRLLASQPESVSEFPR